MNSYKMIKEIKKTIEGTAEISDVIFELLQRINHSRLLLFY